MNKKKITFKNSFSKAEFEVFRKDKNIFIKKILNKPSLRDYQSVLKNNNLQKILKIKNLKIHPIDVKTFKTFKKLKSYESLYINGFSGDLIIKNSGINEVSRMKEFFVNYFKILIKFNKWKKIDNKIFLNKLNSIEKNIKNKELKFIFKKNVATLENKINKINFYPIGVCHGDLTLSNVIIEEKNIYLIDFLKTYHDSILQDLSKIYQEFILGWSSRYLDGTEKLRSEIFYKKIIDQSFFQLFSRKMLNLLNFEVIMTLFRIFPYVQKDDKITINWLSKSVEKVLKSKI